jgi:8-oxo-dGTP pyrophosphatase MutT (NUDIX family)
VTRIIKCLSKNLAYKNKYFAIYDDAVEFPDGSRGSYTRIFEGDSGQTVVVIPCDTNGNIGLIRIYRYGAAKWEWEFPRGLVEKGESLAANARRELLEETSLYAKKLTLVGSFYPNNGLITTIVHVYLAKGVWADGKIRVQNSEGIDKLKFVPRDTLLQMISSGRIKDGFTLSSVFLALMKKVL